MDAAETGTSGDIFIPIQKAWKRYDDSLTELQYASLKSIQTGLLEASPESNCRNTFRIYRQTMAKYGSKRFHEGLKASGILNDDGTTIGTESQRTGSLNIFASIASEAICQDTMIEANKSLGDAGTEFVIACNRPLYDEHWEDADEDWLGKASMSKLHKFVLVRDMHWTWFNLLAVGLCSDEGAKAVDKDRLEAQIETMKRLRETAFKFAKKDGWSDDVKLRSRLSSQLGDGITCAFIGHVVYWPEFRCSKTQELGVRRCSRRLRG